MTPKLDTLLTPASIAVIGASRNQAKVGHAILANLVESGYEGEIVPINPRAEMLLGIPCRPDLKSHGKPVDLAVVAVAPEAVLEEVGKAVEAGARAVAVITSGFREIDRKGERLEGEMVELCRKRGVRLLGPNCLGVINTHHRMNASFARQTPPTGGISVVSQSGALCTAILDWAVSRRQGFAKLVSIGNKADLDEVDLLRHFARDEKTRVIVGYLESIYSGDAFIKAAEAAAAVKPVVMYKTGATRAGARAVTHHTGGRAGVDLAYGAAFKRSGVIRADSYEALFDYATAFSMQPLPKGNRVAVITNAGGPGVMAADALENAGLQLSVFDPGTMQELKSKLPAVASVANPVDLLGDADPARYASALWVVQEDRNVDAIVVILTPQAMTDPEGTARTLAEVAKGAKPVLTSFMGAAEVREARGQLIAAGLPDYPAPERAAGALKAMWDYASWRNRPPRVVARYPANRRRVERIIRRHLKSGRLTVGEVDSKEVMHSYDFTVPPGGVATSVEEAVEVAEKVGYPVAMKIVSPEIVHKSDFEGVRLGLSTPEMIADAYDLMLLRIGRIAPDYPVDGVYVEKMAPPGKEVIIGMTRDPLFGPMLMFGLGGIFVEVISDVTFHLAPVTAEEAMEMLKGTRSYAHLVGIGREDSMDIMAVAKGLQRVSQLATDFPQIKELDINPFMVGPVGTEPMVVSARMGLVDPDLAEEGFFGA